MADWPRSDRVLSFTEKKELQTRLTEAGFDTQGIDGRTGPNTTECGAGIPVGTGLAAGWVCQFEAVGAVAVI